MAVLSYTYKQYTFFNFLVRAQACSLCDITSYQASPIGGVGGTTPLPPLEMVRKIS